MLGNLAALAIGAGRYGPALDRLAEAEAVLDRHAREEWAGEQRRLLAVNRAVAYERLGAFREALAVLDALAGGVDPDPWRAAQIAVNRGVLLRNLGDAAAAERAFAGGDRRARAARRPLRPRQRLGERRSRRPARPARPGAGRSRLPAGPRDRRGRGGPSRGDPGALLPRAVAGRPRASRGRARGARPRPRARRVQPGRRRELDGARGAGADRAGRRAERRGARPARAQPRHPRGRALGDPPTSASRRLLRRQAGGLRPGGRPRRGACARQPAARGRPRRPGPGPARQGAGVARRARRRRSAARRAGSSASSPGAGGRCSSSTRERGRSGAGGSVRDGPRSRPSGRSERCSPRWARPTPSCRAAGNRHRHCSTISRSDCSSGSTDCAARWRSPPTRGCAICRSRCCAPGRLSARRARGGPLSAERELGRRPGASRKRARAGSSPVWRELASTRRRCAGRRACSPPVSPWRRCRGESGSSPTPRASSADVPASPWRERRPRRPGGSSRRRGRTSSTSPPTR